MKACIIILSLAMIVSQETLSQDRSSKSKSGTDISFERVEIDANPPTNPWIKIVGDINGDHRPDVIVGGQKGPLVWYENPTWKRSEISPGGYNTVKGAVGDIDGDGDLDIVLGGVFWYENPGPGDELNQRWRAHKIADYRAHDARVADLDGDGKMDVIVRDQSGFGLEAGNKVILFRQVAADSWTRTEISCPHGEGLCLADVDSDGRIDVIIGNKWYRNPGKIEGADWKEYTLSRKWDYADTRVAVGDINGDGKADVVLSPSESQGKHYKIAWYEHPKDALATEDWAEHVVDEPVETVVHSLDLADVNADGVLDIVAASMHQGAAPREVRVYFNSRSGKKWRKFVVASTGSHEITAVDIDGDGAIDIVGANWSGPYQPVEWWRNTSDSE